jgi:2-amino-4-hydroxy-6-hydroxymethyldihydropteridine diphosphokinase
MGLMHHTAYISLGSNIGDRIANLRDATARLHEAGVVTRTSSWYETEPVEMTEQPWFLNGVVELQTQLAPRALMGTMLKIERAMGRERTQPKGPRIIDLDLLLYDNETVNTPELTVPHPAMHERRFVLTPLVEIAPGAFHPILRKSAFQLLQSLSVGPEVRHYDPPIE